MNPVLSLSSIPAIRLYKDGELWVQVQKMSTDLGVKLDSRIGTSNQTDHSAINRKQMCVSENLDQSTAVTVILR
jgi:hypothetical protein